MSLSLAQGYAVFKAGFPTLAQEGSVWYIHIGKQKLSGEERHEWS